EIPREVPDRLVEQAGTRIIHDVSLELRNHLEHRVARLRDPALDADAHVRDGRVRPHDEAVDPTEKILVVLRRLERMHAPPGARDGKAGRQGAGRVDRQQVPGKSEARTTRLETAGEDVVGEPLLIAERRGIDPAETLEIARAERVEPAAVLLA